MIEGTTIHLLHWPLINELECPTLTCPYCRNCILEADQWDYTKDKGKVTPVYCSSDPTSFTVQMKYKCKNKKCKHNVIHAGDSHLMNTLPFSVTSAYPVHCRFIERNYHLSSAASFLLESTMVTYGSGEHVMKCLLQRQNSLHNDKIHRFADKVRLWQIRNKGTLYTLASNSSTNLDMIPSFIHLMTQYSTFQVPSGKNLRQLYVKKADSKLTPYGVRDNKRFTREIQAVGINQSFAQDHTFEGTKNWQKSLGAKAIWDVSNELGEICSAVLVPL